jgi:hypothetical protein
MLAGTLLWIEAIDTGLLLKDGDPLVEYLERVRALHGGIGT